MKHVVIIGGGTAGTVAANSLIRRLNPHEFRLTVIDYSARHYYHPGFLTLTMGRVPNPLLWRWRHQTFLPGIHYLQERVTLVNPDKKIITTPTRRIPYDYLVIATGCECRPELVEGMTKGTTLAQDIHTFYTLAAAKRLRRVMQSFDHGKLVVHICEFPIRCPVAPVEFALRADDYFFNRRVRDDIEITIVTPQSQVYEQQVTARNLANLLRLRDIEVVPDFVVRHVDADEKRMYSYDGRIVDYDLLVTAPPMRGNQFIIDSGLGDEMGYLHPNLETLQHKKYPDIFVLGDAADLPTSKAGSAAVYQARVFVTNFLNYIKGEAMTRYYDGHAVCIVDTSHTKSTMIDRSYEVPAVTGKWPLPHLGPFSLLKATRFNHFAKRAMFLFYSVVMLAPRIFDRISDIQLVGKRFSRWGLRADGTTPLSTPPLGRDSTNFITPAWKRHPNACVAAAFSTKVLEIPIRHEAAGVHIDINHEGFMTRPSQWTEDIGADLAQGINLEITPRHWEIIRFARQSFLENQVSPTLRRFEITGGFPIAELFELFPFKPSKLIAYVAGIPKPVGCI